MSAASARRFVAPAKLGFSSLVDLGPHLHGNCHSTLIKTAVVMNRRAQALPPQFRPLAEPWEAPAHSPSSVSVPRAGVPLGHPALLCSKKGGARRLPECCKVFPALEHVLGNQNDVPGMVREHLIPLLEGRRRRLQRIRHLAGGKSDRSDVADITRHILSMVEEVQRF